MHERARQSLHPVLAFCGVMLVFAAACGARPAVSSSVPEPLADASSSVNEARVDSARAADALIAESAQSKPYSEFQVDKKAVMAPGNWQMRYPESLRKAQVEGTVLVSFVVDEQGAIDMSTFRVLRSDDELFTSAVRNAVVRIRYVPAELNGQRVKQLVQQPFQFSLQRKSADTLAGALRSFR